MEITFVKSHDKREHFACADVVVVGGTERVTGGHQGIGIESGCIPLRLCVVSSSRHHQMKSQVAIRPNAHLDLHHRLSDEYGGNVGPLTVRPPPLCSLVPQVVRLTASNEHNLGSSPTSGQPRAWWHHLLAANENALSPAPLGRALAFPVSPWKALFAGVNAPRLSQVNSVCDNLERSVLQADSPSRSGVAVVAPSFPLFGPWQMDASTLILRMFPKRLSSPLMSLCLQKCD
ncbi:unnamed protein product [Mesocestoides corti]|uniref:Uncharacterized protein n=1 Tax=Mesocestoides corti TaxID=53468 RepID=A0A0R3UA93_MESCO|nr:unnamed protein product [Mesocestoides corti]